MSRTFVMVMIVLGGLANLQAAMQGASSSSQQQYMIEDARQKTLDSMTAAAQRHLKEDQGHVRIRTKFS